MGQCISTEQPSPAANKGTQRAAQYLEDGANRSIVEGLSQAYRVIKLLGSGAWHVVHSTDLPGLHMTGLLYGSNWLGWLLPAFVDCLLVLCLCAGAEGNTWLVQDVHTNKPWAIKLIQLPLPTRLVQAIFRCDSSRMW
jgi:hypothetical protein